MSYDLDEHLEADYEDRVSSTDQFWLNSDEMDRWHEAFEDDEEDDSDNVD